MSQQQLQLWHLTTVQTAVLALLLLARCTKLTCQQAQLQQMMTLKCSWMWGAAGVC
jgi:hypothetical protein